VNGTKFTDHLSISLRNKLNFSDRDSLSLSYPLIIQLHLNQISEAQNKRFWKTNLFIKSFIWTRMILKLTISSLLTLLIQIIKEIQIRWPNTSSSQPDYNKEKLKQLFEVDKMSDITYRSSQLMGLTSIWWREVLSVTPSRWWVMLMELSCRWVLCKT